MRRKTIHFLPLALLFLIASVRAFALSVPEGLALVTARGWEVQEAARLEDAAAAELDRAGSGRFPRVEAFARTTMLADQPRAIFAAGSSPVAQTVSTSLGVSANQVIYDFGRTGWAVASAQAGLEARRLQREKAASSAARDFVAAYATALEARRILSVSEEEAGRFEAHLSEAQALHREGVVTVNDVLIAEVNLADARQRVVRARYAVQMSISRLNYLLGQPLSEAASLDEMPVPALDAEKPLEEYQKEAREGRPEILGLLAQVRALEAREAGLAADGYPVLTAGAAYEYKENRFQDPQDNWTLTAGASWTLYSGGRVSAARRQASAELAAARTRLAQASEAAALEVTEAFTTLKSSREGLLVTEKSVDQARESLRLEKAMYQEGEATSSEVTDAVTRLARAEQTRWTAVYALRRSEAQLLYACGADLPSAYAARTATDP